MPGVMVRAVVAVAAVLLAGCGDEPAREQPEPRETVVWAVGDAATPGAAPRALASLIVRGPVDRLVYLGDVYEEGTLAEFRRYYEPLYGRLAARTAPVLGNHEYANRRRGYQRYWRGKLGRAPRPWYALRAGGWQLLALSSESPHGRGSRQVRWLRRRVRRPTTCRIAFMHRARYSAGERHGDQPDLAPLWDALRGRAAAVVSGHDHDLQRLEPIDGIVQFVSGAGGRALHDVDDADDRVAFAEDARYGALRLELRPGVAEWAFVADDGEVLDEGALRCRGARR
jgi:hypothetical protein